VTPFVRRFLKRVQNTVAKHQLWGPKESFIIAVSGGPDSLCLLDLLFLLSQKYDFTLHIVHVNYQLRDRDSDSDEELVRESATRYHIPLTVFHPKKTSRSNLEEKLRDIRYRLFEQVRTKKNATLIAVAHHEDDQAETFLLRLLRGSGMLGLSAMRPKNNFVIRPLIEMSRADILRYLKERDIPYRVDESNGDPTFLRNQLRRTLIPFIEERYQSNIKKILADTASLLATDYALLESLPSFSSTNKSGIIEFSVANFQKLPESLARHELRLLLKPYYGEKSPPKGVLDEVQKLINSTKNKHQILKLPGLKIERKGAIVRLLNFSI
jgi:tRNA(Ile)-lysidine synthase